MEKISILIADDHKLIREAWAYIIGSDDRFELIAECGTGEDAIELSRQFRPNVIIMDIFLPGINGIEATEQIKKFSPDSKILGVSMHNQAAYARSMMKKGALGYVTKSSSRDEMFRAIMEVAAGRKYICEEIKNILSEQLVMKEEQNAGIESLSKIEIEIIKKIKKGAYSKEIASDLNIPIKKVESHRRNILIKLNLRNVNSLVNFVSNHPDFR
jgi:two-component system invasion response regulator UvrY